MDTLSMGEIVDCKAVQFAAACISLWPERELTIEVPEGVDEEQLCVVFRAFGCHASPVAA